MAQEILSTFSDEINGVLLKPAAISGQYSILAGETLVFDRKENGRFPEIKELKQLIRDIVCPGKNLGHSDRPTTNN